MIVLKISSNHSNVLSIPGAQTLGRQCDFISFATLVTCAVQGCSSNLWRRLSSCEFFIWAAWRHISVVSVSSFSPSHPEGSGVSGRATCIREPLCGVSMLPFPPSFCRVCLLSFGATFEFREAPGELSGLAHAPYIYIYIL